MIKIEIDDVTVNNTPSMLSFLFCHLFSPFLLRISITTTRSEINEGKKRDGDENQNRRRVLS
jgi:hypothetical protein